VLDAGSRHDAAADRAAQERLGLPRLHEAVLHEEGDGDPVVAEVLRTGYLWNSRVLRPAMVKVRG